MFCHWMLQQLSSYLVVCQQNNFQFQVSFREPSFHLTQHSQNRTCSYNPISNLSKSLLVYAISAWHENQTIGLYALKSS